MKSIVPHDAIYAICQLQADGSRENRFLGKDTDKRLHKSGNMRFMTDMWHLGLINDDKKFEEEMESIMGGTDWKVHKFLVLEETIDQIDLNSRGILQEMSRAEVKTMVRKFARQNKRAKERLLRRAAANPKAYF